MANNPFENQTPIDGVKKIIAVASGKGGVGKSTVASNLAVALSKLDFKVGLLDADLYGPSQPRMFGALKQKPMISPTGKMIPLERYGIKLMSIGFLIEDDVAVIWRGPMLFKAVEQLLRDVDWGKLDYLLVDLPPGTGDVQLTLAQKVPVNGALTICTPQDIALIDVKRSIDMFKKVNIPLIGVVENMSEFIDENGNRHRLYPKGNLANYLKDENINLIGEIPFITKIAQGAEIGIPAIEGNEKDESIQSYFDLAKKVVEST